MVASLHTERRAGSRTSPALMIDTPHSCQEEVCRRERERVCRRERERAHSTQDVPFQ